MDRRHGGVAEPTASTSTASRHIAGSSANRIGDQLIVRMASENRDWGYDRIVGALANLGYVISDQTVGNILHRHAPAPERKRTDHMPKSRAR